MSYDQNKKYHIVDDGSIYKINDDGSFTSMGNVNSYKQQAPKASNRKFTLLWWAVGILFVTNISICGYTYFTIYDLLYDHVDDLRESRRNADSELIRHANEWSETHFNSKIYSFDYFDYYGHPTYNYEVSVDTMVDTNAVDSTVAEQ